MSEQQPEDAAEVSRWYTHTRKFPQFIGKTHSGSSVWGGPYTFMQLGVFAGVVWAGTKTYWLWGRSDIITNALTLVAVAYGLALLAGKLPIGLRSPLSVLMGIWKAYATPGTGRYAGARVRFAKPHRVGGRTQLVQHPALVRDPAPTVAAESVAEQAVPEPTPAAAPAGGRPPALTGVQLLLASSSKH